MKKFTVIILSSAALALAGCDNNKGGSSDQYNTGSGADSTPNYNRNTISNIYQDGVLNTDPGFSTNVPAGDTNGQGAASSPGRFRVGAAGGTSYSAGDTNPPGTATSPRKFDGGGQPVEPNSTNAAPDK